MPHRFKSLPLTIVSGCCLTLAVANALAQDATTGSITGTISDSSGAVIKGATVVLVNTDRNHVERTLTTNSSGFYTARSLPLGNYAVKISDQGFNAATVTGVALHVGDALTVNRALTAGGGGEAVTIRADAARVNLEDPTSAGLIDSNQMNEMPLVTRNYGPF
jgi:hypothetical protein